MAFSLACDAGKTTLRIEGADSNVTWNDIVNAGFGSVAVDGGGTEDPHTFVRPANQNYYTVTGTLTPDVTGDYFYQGMLFTSYSNKPFYEKAGSQYHIWHTITGDVWHISPKPATNSEPYWTRNDPDIEGEYEDEGDEATGMATVTKVAVVSPAYRVLKNIQFGDGTNALTFYSKNEMVYFDDDQIFTIKSNATLQLGEIAGDYCINGACWSWEGAGNVINVSNPNAACKIYGSTIHYRGTGQITFSDGTVDFRNSQFHADNRADAKLSFSVGVDSLTLKHLYIDNWNYWQTLKTPDIMESVWLHYPTNGFRFYAIGETTIVDCLVTDAADMKVVLAWPLSAQIVNFINPRWNLVQSDVSIANANSVLYWKYTCDVHIADKDGNNLSGVAVTCEDKDSNQVFSVQTGADGKIAQQIITYKKWEGTSETETEYNPHKFIFSKNGYTLLVMENVTVDARTNWDIEVKFPERIRARMANLGRLAILR